MNIIMLRVADWSKIPAGRYRSDGTFSAEEYREDVLFPALALFDSVTVDLDGCFGLGSSFLDEVFGGVVRSGKFTEEELSYKLIIKSDSNSYKARVAACMKAAW